MKTQIFGTFGPACISEEVLEKMIEAGMTGMRLNLSHTSLVESEAYIRNYQKASEKVGVKAQILIDMQGPELRVGKLQEDIVLEKKAKIPAPAEVIQTLEPGDEVLLDDGKILVRVLDISVQENTFDAEVVRGGILRSHKSIKVVGKNITLPPLTSHDLENIKMAKEYGVTALMQPFVLCGEDLKQVRNVLVEHGAEEIQIFAKIENRLGVEHIQDILPEADVIVIARGDLGNDMPLWELPKVQKEIEEACKVAGKPYIVVTQMLASMEQNPVPTRAEVSDIYHAVHHGAWGVMLTGETAVGKYPIDAIKYLANTARTVDNNTSF